MVFFELTRVRDFRILAGCKSGIPSRKFGLFGGKNQSVEPTKLSTVFNRKEDFMAEKSQVYKCTMCGNIVEVLHGGAGKLSCCGQLMVLLKDEEAKNAKGK